MNEYELKVYEEVDEWKRKINKTFRDDESISKKAQGKINGINS